MKKIAIILDSFCGKTKQEVEKNENFFFIPLQIDFNGSTLRAGETQEINDEIDKLLSSGEVAKTSMPTPGDTLSVFKKTSEDYEHVFYFPLSSAISGTAQAAKNMSKDFKNIDVIETHIVGDAFFTISNRLITLAKKDDITIEQLKDVVTNFVKNEHSQTLVIPRSIAPLEKSGRVGKIASNILDKFKLIPVISYEWDNKKLHNRGFKKSGKKAVEFAIKKIQNFIDGRDKFTFLITHTMGHEVLDLAKKILNNENLTFIYEKASPMIRIVCGENAISLSAYIK